MTFTVTDGWVEEAKHEPVVYHSNGWPHGNPRGVMLHFQAGCGDPFDSFNEKHNSAHFSIQRDASVIQYVSLRDMSWHAHEGSNFFFGIESAVSPPVCDYTVPMLEAMAELAATCMDWAEAQFGTPIPTVRSPGAAFDPGVKCHNDGISPDSLWDPKRHWDAPWKAEGDAISKWTWEGGQKLLNRSPWTSQQMLDAIKGHRGEEVELALLNDEEQQDLKDFLEILRKNLGSFHEDQDVASVTGAARRVARSVLESEKEHGPPPEGDDDG